MTNEKKILGMLIAVFAVLAVSSIAYARELPLSESNITDNKIVTDDAVYNIVYYTETYLPDGSVAKRIVVEDQNKIGVLENESAALFARVDQVNEEFRAVNANASEINERRNNVAAAIELINQQQEFSRNDTAGLQERKQEIDKVLTGNVALSPLAFRVALIVFVMLLILVIAAHTTGIFSRGKPREKTPYEEDEF